MRIVVTYDISDTKRRTKIMKTLEGYGHRVQYSVFECHLDARKISKLRARLKPLVRAEAGESIRFYLLCGECADRVKVLGKETRKELRSLLVV